MQINSINPQYRAFGSSFDYIADAPDRDVVINRVKDFIEAHGLHFIGKVKITSTGAEYENIGISHDSVPYCVDTPSGPKRISLKGNSVNDIAYQFAKIAKGKILYNPAVFADMAAIGHVGNKGFRQLKVPDFFEAYKIPVIFG